MPEFKDLSSAKGLEALNTFLATRSYIEGFSASQEDVCVFDQISRPVDGKFVHVNRWFSHINSFAPEARSRFPGAKTCSKGGKEEKKGAPAKEEKKAAPAKKEEPEEEEAEMDFDSLGNSEDSEEVAKILADKNKTEAKPKKAGPIAKSTIIIDVKPMGSETDMKKLESAVREIAQEGLLWGGAELIPVAYGVKKLRIVSVVVDDLVSVDDLQEKIEAIEDCQSTDIHAFNKI